MAIVVYAPALALSQGTSLTFNTNKNPVILCDCGLHEMSVEPCYNSVYCLQLQASMCGLQLLGSSLSVYFTLQLLVRL